ncbi:hypothetical protein AgCh_017818 [Apium graveolens]
MVLSLPTREVKQSVFDEEVLKLAHAALPDSSQQSLHNHYIRAASGLLGPILKKNDKIIVEDMNNTLALSKGLTVMAERVLNNSNNNGDEVPGRDEDEDLDAHNYPLI